MKTVRNAAVFLWMMLFGLAQVAASATLSLDIPATGQPGKTITAKIGFANATGVKAFKIVINYSSGSLMISDPSKFSRNATYFPSALVGGVEANFYDDYSTNKITLVGLYPKDMSGAATVGNLVFTLSDKAVANDTQVVTLGGEIFDSSGAVSSLLAVSKTVTVSTSSPALAVTPASRSVANTAGTTTFGVSNTGTGTMAWSAQVTSGGTWLRITSGVSGSNTGTINCGFDANTGSTVRTGTIRVTAASATGSPKDVTVIQASTMPKIDHFLGIWSDGVWFWDKSANKWSRMANTSNALMMAAGKVDSDNIDDLIGVWSSGIYFRRSTDGQWVKLSSTLPTWITSGDLNNDGQDDVIVSWKNDGVYYRDSVTGKWVKLASPAKQVAAGKIGGIRDDLVGVWNDGLWVRYSQSGSWVKLDSEIPVWIAVGDMNGDKRPDFIGTYSRYTSYLGLTVNKWIGVATPAEQIAAGDIDGDGRDELIGVWSNGVWIKYPKTGIWQQISTSKPKWISSGKLVESVQTIDSLEDPSTQADVIDLSFEAPNNLTGITDEGDLIVSE